MATATPLYLRYDGDIGSGTDNHALNVGLRLRRCRPHARLSLLIARFREAARREIFAQARRFDDVRTVYVNDRWFAENFVDGTPDPMAGCVRLFNDDAIRLV